MGPLSQVETLLGKLLTSQRGRDAKLLTRLLPSTRSMPASITVTSPSLGRSNGALRHEHTPMAANIFPDLAWSVDSTTVNNGAFNYYLLIVEDADAPLPSPIVHGLYYNIPASRTSVGPKDFKVQGETGRGTGKQKKKTAGAKLVGGFRSGQTWSGLVWSGPKPVLGHGTHRYFFQVLALNEPLQAPDESGAPLSKETLLRTGMLEGKVLAWGEWIGTYER